MIIKPSPAGEYARVPNDVLRCGTLSLSALGLYSLLCSLPPKWEPSVVGFSRIIPDGRTKLRSAISELERSGCLTRETTRTEGKFAGTVWRISSPPDPGQRAASFRSADDPPSGYPSTVSPPQYNKIKYNKDKIKKDHQGGRKYDDLFF